MYDIYTVGRKVTMNTFIYKSAHAEMSCILNRSYCSNVDIHKHAVLR